MTRDGLLARHWAFPGNTVTTVERVKADLRGWQLNRCLFVGDAGMISQANLKSSPLSGLHAVLGRSDSQPNLGVCVFCQHMRC